VPVSPRRTVLALFSLVAFAAAQDLPLPQAGPAPAGGSGFIRPTATIKPPVANPTAQKPDDAREAAIRAMEQRLLKEQEMRQVAAAAKQGDTAALRQLIVMAGPIDASILKSPVPPSTIEGQVALIGVQGGERIGKSLEQFFGAPLNPDREKLILETVRSQIAGTSNMDVKVAGWWPKEGVMAVTLVPRS
jgi:hypothetical protein